MVRAPSRMFTAVIAMIAVMVSACGSPAPKTSADELFQEYTKSTNVKNDKFESEGSSADRLATFAAYYTPEQLSSALLSASPCDSDCPPSGKAREAARDFAGAAGKVFERSVLVKHGDGSLELITLYVARKSDKTAALIDADGRTYTAGLEDFRRNNGLLGSDDVFLTPRDITSVPGTGKIVAVSGHTAMDWQPWLIAGIAALAVLGAGLAVIRRRMTRAGELGPG